MWAWVAAAPLVSAAGTWLARRYAVRRGLLDAPGERRSHTVATPRGGGIGLVVAIAMLVVAFGASGHMPGIDWRWWLAGFVAVAAIGAWDDHRPLGARLRLAVHVAAGLTLAVALPGGRDPLQSVLVVAAVAIAVNVWNFMDGIDGVAATQAAIVAALAAWLAPAPFDAFALGVVLAILAFVPFNFPKARIFMGDVGSGALGYALVALAFVAFAPIHRDNDVVLLLFPASAFLVDAALTLALRIVQRERWWAAHTRHLYQGLARLYGHPRTTLGYAAWSLGACGIALWARGQGGAFIMTSLLLCYTAAVALWAGLRHRMNGWSHG